VVKAPGFEDARSEVDVRGETGECDCPVVTPERLALQLVRIP
jgi:hypothetical protein